MRLPFEAFLALRYLRPRKTFVSIITVISIIGVTIGVAVLIIVISVMSGFDREWKSRILGFNAHLKLYQLEQPGSREVPLRNFEQVISKLRAAPNVIGAAPFVRGQVLVKTQPPEGTNPKVFAPLLRGIDPDMEKTVSVLATNIIAGAYDVSRRSLLIGKEFANAMDLRVDDRVLIYSPNSLEELERAKTREDAEAVLRAPNEFTVRGIFDVGFSEYNASVIVASLDRAQELYDFNENSVHGIQVMLSDPMLSERVRRDLMPKLGPNYFIQTWQEENPHIFNALAVEKNMMFYLLFVIMIVAAFGIVNSQITFVVQKTREIGILKAIGATRMQVLWLFLSQSLIVGVLGVASGLGLGLLALRWRNEFLQLMNKATGSELLPSTIYQISDLPAAIEPRDVTLICCLAFLACLLAGLFPAWKASRLLPVEALRHE